MWIKCFTFYICVLLCNFVLNILRSFDLDIFSRDHSWLSQWINCTWNFWLFIHLIIDCPINDGFNLAAGRSIFHFRSDWYNWIFLCFVFYKRYNWINWQRKKKLIYHKISSNWLRMNLFYILLKNYIKSVI